MEERIKMIKAMEYIARQLNDEILLSAWLMYGVADGDIPYGDFSVEESDYEEMEFLISDDDFSEIMGLFLRIMADAKNEGGLYCDGILDNN